MPTSTWIITIAPDRDGKTTMWASMRGADGAPLGPPRIAVLDNRLGAFVADMQALARHKLATLESAAVIAAPDNKPAIIADAADGK